MKPFRLMANSTGGSLFHLRRLVRPPEPQPASGNRLARPAASAADLKFLHRLRQTHFRNFKSKSGTRIICLLVPLLLPKFVSEDAAMYHELRKRGTSGGDTEQERPSRQEAAPRPHRDPGFAARLPMIGDQT